ncbi:MAG: hypothetical protein NVSMB28_24310 [Collimonas sp.]
MNQQREQNRQAVGWAEADMQMDFARFSYFLLIALDVKLHVVIMPDLDMPNSEAARITDCRLNTCNKIYRQGSPTQPIVSLNQPEPAENRPQRQQPQQMQTGAPDHQAADRCQQP